MSSQRMIEYTITDSSARHGIRYVLYHADDNLDSADGQYRPVTIRMAYQQPRSATVVSEGYTDLASHVPTGVRWKEVSTST